jgi:hypothetical protein
MCIIIWAIAVWYSSSVRRGARCYRKVITWLSGRMLRKEQREENLKRSSK